MHRNFRKPMVIAAPKIGLKHPLAVSKLEEFANGTTFQPILSKSFGENKVKKVVFCSGKIAFDIESRLEKNSPKSGVKVVRVEEIAPFPVFQIKETLLGVDPAAELVWV
jgi:2-oxoglutarate dehydrogenase complex dehydrogenase (E1) component-like enzyme